MPAHSIAVCLNSRTKRCFVFPRIWWRLGESNSWPPACKAGALPTKLSPQLINKSMLWFSVCRWWVWQDLNLWPHAYQACALTNWATDPQIHRHEEQLVVDSYQSSSLSLRRWSSRRFPYGYLVTTSPQSSVPPSAAGSIKVTPPTSGVTNSRGVTGGVYKARERIHRGMLIHDY